MNLTNRRMDPPVLGLATLPLAHGNATPAERQVRGTCPGTAVSRCCCRCGKVGRLGKACSSNTHLKIPKPVQVNGTADKATPQFAYGLDEDSSKGDKSPTPTDTASTTGLTNSSQYVYPESHESHDSERSQKQQTTYAEMGRIINFMNGHDGFHVS